MADRVKKKGDTYSKEERVIHFYVYVSDLACIQRESLPKVYRTQKK